MPILICIILISTIVYFVHKWRAIFLAKLQPAVGLNSLIVEQMSSGIVILDASLKITFCNTSAAKMLDYPQQEIVGSSFPDLVFPCRDENGQDITIDNFPPYVTLETSNPIINFRLEYNKPDGEKVWFVLSSQILNSGDNDNGILLVTLIDISFLQEQLQQKTSLALEQERANMIGQFVQSASHEFRTPLSVLQLNMDLLVKHKINGKLMRYIDQANTQIERLATLVEKLLLIAELDSWNSLPLQEISINSLLNEIITELTNSEDIKSRTLKLDITLDLPSILGNDYYLMTAFEEIIDNAVHYTTTDSKLSIRANSHDNVIEIIVEDTGIGIDAEDVKHVFKRFWRKDKMHSTPGFGLGLPLAQRIINLHRGTIALESKLQNGTKVTIKLPSSNLTIPR